MTEKANISKARLLAGLPITPTGPHLAPLRVPNLRQRVTRPSTPARSPDLYTQSQPQRTILDNARRVQDRVAILLVWTLSLKQGYPLTHGIMRGAVDGAEEGENRDKQVQEASVSPFELLCFFFC